MSDPLCPECYEPIGLMKVDRHPGPFLLIDRVVTGLVERQPICECGWTMHCMLFPEINARPLTDEESREMRGKIQASWDAAEVFEVLKPDEREPT